MTNPTFPDSSFGQRHFGNCQLGDQRRTKRLVQLADQILAHPHGPLTQKIQHPADYQSCCRLVNQPDVTHHAVLEPHQQLTQQQLRDQNGVVLILHDTTELDFSGHHSLALGQIGNGKGTGYLCHNSLAVDPHGGQIFGLLKQILHQRRRVPKGEGVAAKRSHADRESRLWVRAVEAIGPTPDGALWVDVCDRGADTFEFVEYECHHGRSFVIRSTHNRALEVDAEDDQPQRLHDRLRAAPAWGCWTTTIAGSADQPPRRARLQATAMPVRLQAPHVRRGEHGRASVPVWAIRVWEVEAPPGVEPVEWLLLTDQPVPTPSPLRERVGWYERRSLIEEYHKSQKTGVSIEDLRFQSRAGLEPVIGILSVVAVALVNLRVGARQESERDRPAGELVDGLWVEVLSVWRYGEVRSLTVAEFTLALGRLGGHQNRKSDGLPGWQTLWRGWYQLHAMIAYEMARQKCDKH